MDTGRIVPVETLELALQQVPTSVKILSPLVDFFCEIHNGSNEISSSNNQYFISQNISGNHVNDVQIVTPDVSWESFQNQWRQYCRLPDNNTKFFEKDKDKGLPVSLIHNTSKPDSKIGIEKSIDKETSRL